MCKTASELWIRGSQHWCGAICIYCDILFIHTAFHLCFYVSLSTCVYTRMDAWAHADLNKTGFHSEQSLIFFSVDKIHKGENDSSLSHGGSGVNINLWFIVVVKLLLKWECCTHFALELIIRSNTTLPTCLRMENDWEKIDKRVGEEARKTKKERQDWLIKKKKERTRDR